MRVAYFSPTYFSDVDISLLMQLQHMVDVDYFVPTGANIKGAAFDVRSYVPKSGIFEATEAYPELQKIASLIDKVHFYVVNAAPGHMWRLRNLKLYLQFVWRLRHYDVIHLTEFPKWYLAPLYILRKKMVLTVHDPFPHSDKNSNTRSVLLARKWGFRLFKHFIILNQSQRDACIAHYALQEKQVYDSRLSRYDYLQIYTKSISVSQPYFLFFGQINEHKGIDMLLPAMLELYKTYPQYRLILAGRGEFSMDIKPYESLPFIEFRHRFIPDWELAELIQGATCCICPYRDATQSGVVMSAFAFNKPVIATNVGGLSEQVVDERYGMLIPPCDISALTSAMCDVIENPLRWQGFAQNIEQDYATGKQSWKQIACGLKQIYQQVMQS